MSRSKDETLVYHGNLDSLEPGDRSPCVQVGDGEMKIGTLRRANPGEPVGDHEQCVELRSVRPGVSAMRPHKPAQVANQAYREGYDRIFGGKQEVGQA